MQSRREPMPFLPQPTIYHIVHASRLSSIIRDRYLWCDAKMTLRGNDTGISIGMNKIKKRRLEELTLDSHPDLHVGDCVPFYFCPRSIMLYMIYRRNHPELTYRGGQDPIIHLQANLHEAVTWADSHDQRWAFTSSNAGSYTFEDYADLSQLDQLNWDAIRTNQWSQRIDGKQAEFLMEYSFPWKLISRIGVNSRKTTC